MRMKKLIALLLALTLLPGAILAEDAPADPVEDTVYTNLRVGNPTPMRGEFFTELWGNATSDIDVRDLLHGYNLVYWNGANGLFTVDPTVVRGLAVTEDPEGNRNYVLVLCEDLFYSDGSPITAWDYAFSYLLQIAPEIEEIGGTPLRTAHLRGYQEYVDGAAPCLRGVRVLADDTLMITIDHEYLPFFYELGLLACNPYPIGVIAPGVAVRDDGDGVYLANADASVAEPLFTPELLRETILNPETGYQSHPAVVSGPYTLTSWDGVTAEFAINPYFKGNIEGVKPSIPTLTYTLADNETMVEQLVNGEFGLLNKVMRADSILKGIETINEGDIRMRTYPRIGMGYISFACERPTVSSLAVRQAIAWCMDRDEVTADYTNTFGLRVDGYYGIGQWMYGIANGTIAPPLTPPEDEHDRAAAQAYEEALAAYEELSLDGLTVYTVDTARAARLLEGDGWRLNSDGLREKDGVVLDLRMIYPEGNNIYASFERLLVPNLAQVGIRLTLEAVPMAELLSRYYKQGERDMDLIFLASNFDIVFDPAVNFLPTEAGEQNWGYTNLADEELYQQALNMRQTQPGDVLTYMQHWVAFQQRFNEILPMLPIYSNVYFDFFTYVLRDYMIAENATWGQAIVAAYMSDIEPLEETPEEAAEGEDLP